MGRKLATFFRQLKHLSFARMKLHINAVHEETGKNRLAIFCDMVWCEVRYGIGYLDYHVFGFANRRGAVRKTYMTAVQNQALTRQMNDPAYFYQLNDKIEFDTIFSDLLKRRFLDLRKTDAAGLREFCAGTEAIFCKPAGLCGGEGIQRLITADIDDYDALYDRLVKGGQLLIEEPIRQHPDMNKLCPDSVNTVRIVTLVTAQGAQMVYALVRMGMGGVCVDNVSSGGMYAPVNEHGQLYRPAFCRQDRQILRAATPSPVRRSRAFQIPLFDQGAGAVPHRVQAVEAHLKYIGWTWPSRRTAPCWWRATTCPVTICARTPAMWTRVCCPGSRSCWAAPLCDETVCCAPRGETEIRRTDNASYAQKRQGT